SISPQGTEEISRGAGDCRGEIGIVSPPLDDRLLFDQGLIFPVQIEPRFDRDRTIPAEGAVGRPRGSEATHFAPGIRVQFEAPADGAIACRFSCSDTAGS